MSSELDHLVWGTNDLDRGRAGVDELLAARSVTGGVHPGVGTRNALVGLERRQYFEILGPDPAQSTFTGFGRLIETLEQDRLVTWAGRSDDLDRLADRARRAGASPGEILDMSRRRPDGTRLRWRLMTVDGHGFGPLVPFFIQWAADHPADALPPAARLTELRLESDRPRELRALLDALGLEDPTITVVAGSEPRLEARLRRVDGTEVMAR